MSQVINQKKYQKIFTVSTVIFVLIVLLSSVFVFTNYAEARNLSDAFGDKSALEGAANQAGFEKTTGQGNLNTVLSRIIQAALSFMGVIFILLMIYGGYLWMSDQGNEEQVKKAKNLIIAAIVGAAIVGSAYAISWFVISIIGDETLREEKPVQKSETEQVMGG